MVRIVWDDIILSGNSLSGKLVQVGIFRMRILCGVSCPGVGVVVFCLPQIAYGRMSKDIKHLRVTIVLDSIMSEIYPPFIHVWDSFIHQFCSWVLRLKVRTRYI